MAATELHSSVIVWFNFLLVSLFVCFTDFSLVSWISITWTQSTCHSIRPLFGPILVPLLLGLVWYVFSSMFLVKVRGEAFEKLIASSSGLLIVVTCNVQLGTGGSYQLMFQSFVSIVPKSFCMSVSCKLVPVVHMSFSFCFAFLLSFFRGLEL